MTRKFFRKKSDPPAYCKRCKVLITNPCNEFYCTGRCHYLNKRTIMNLSPSEQLAHKAEYDRKRRAVKSEQIKAQKREHYYANHARILKDQAAARKTPKRRKYHSEYCRKYYSDPKRKAEKVLYDEIRRAELQFGPTVWADCWRILKELTNEIRRIEPNWYERAKARGYYDNKRTVQQRKRDEQISRW